MYRHTQLLGWPILIAVGAGIIATGVVGVLNLYWISLAVSLVLLATLVLFFSLTVRVDKQAVKVMFGPGLVRKHIPLSQIQSCRPVRNKWYYGWGVRLIPGGMMYNVAGLDAVELVLANGYKFRIGTDEPSELQAAISRVLRR